jgi:hypothetical protein
MYFTGKTDHQIHACGISNAPAMVSRVKSWDLAPDLEEKSSIL